MHPGASSTGQQKVIIENSLPVQVGASTGVSARAAWRYDKRTTLHSSARVSVVGGPSQVELGARYRLGRLTSTGLAVAYGTQVLPLPSASLAAQPSPALTCQHYPPGFCMWLDPLFDLIFAARECPNFSYSALF